MAALYPLKFSPILQERIWGGEKLKTNLQKKGALKGIGESWEISGVSGHVSKVANGPLKDVYLTALIEEFKGKLLGDKVYELFGKDFPILIKFIDAAQDLSIQVHPNDQLAQKRHACAGKNEMWYVMEAAQNARLIVGFKEGVSQVDYIKNLENNKLERILETHLVKEGDSFYIETGTIHAIGAGVLLAEIQQTSDITYRVYDFNRKDSAGNSRELHTESALEALSFEHRENYKSNYDTQTNKANLIEDTPYFKTNFLPVKGQYKKNFTVTDSFKIYICVKGSAEVENCFGSEIVHYGETVLLAASSEFVQISSENGAVFLEVSYP